MKSRSLAVLVVVVLAGCGGIIGGGETHPETATATPTPAGATSATPAETPTDTPTATATATQTPGPAQTPTPSPEHPDIDPAIRESYEQFGQAIDRDMPVAFEYEIINESAVQVTAEPDFFVRTQYRPGEENEYPLPHKVALEMASREDAPELVVIRVRDRDTGSVEWQTSMTTEIARGFANTTLLPDEFEQRLRDRESGVLFDEDQRARLVFSAVQGDRARRVWAKRLVSDLRDSKYSEAITVNDYGLYNESVNASALETHVDENESVMIEFQVPRDGGERYRYERGKRDPRNSKAIFLMESEVAYFWSERIGTRPYEPDPVNIHIRFVDEEGTLFQTSEIPSVLIKSYNNEGNERVDTLFDILWFGTELQEYHNGGPVD
jgi:hypothetical protein